MDPSMQRQLMIWLGLAMLIVGSWAYFDATFIHPKAASYAASLVGGSMLVYPVIAIIGVAVLVLGYRMKLEPVKT